MIAILVYGFPSDYRIDNNLFYGLENFYNSTYSNFYGVYPFINEKDLNIKGFCFDKKKYEYVDKIAKCFGTTARFTLGFISHYGGSGEIKHIETGESLEEDGLPSYKICDGPLSEESKQKCKNIFDVKESDSDDNDSDSDDNDSDSDDEGSDKEIICREDTKYLVIDIVKTAEYFLKNDSDTYNMACDVDLYRYLFDASFITYSDESCHFVNNHYYTDIELVDFLMKKICDSDGGHIRNWSLKKEFLVEDICDVEGLFPEIFNKDIKQIESFKKEPIFEQPKESPDLIYGFFTNSVNDELDSFSVRGSESLYGIYFKGKCLNFTEEMLYNIYKNGFSVPDEYKYIDEIAKCHGTRAMLSLAMVNKEINEEKLSENSNIENKRKHIECQENKKKMCPSF